LVSIKINAIVIDYGGKPVGKIRKHLKILSIKLIFVQQLLIMLTLAGKKLEDDIKQMIQKI
jgi:hypothetical protein